MKKIFCALFACLFCAATNNGKSTTERLVSPNERVEHLFTHCLISHPEIAFSDGNSYGKHLDRDCLTPKEFEKILSALYENGFALTDIDETFETTNGTAKRKAFLFPKNKKPLILSFDDVVYAEKNKGMGMSDKLVLGNDGKIYAETNGKKHEKEFLPIVENFIEKHPDFSPHGARGILFLTGFNGILGYRTQKNSPEKESETVKAKRLVKKLKKLGWKIGSHSYAHGHMKTYTSEQMKADAEKWETEVMPITGKTQLYAYPYGEWTLGEELSDERAEILIEKGYRVFFGVGEAYFFTGMPLHSQKQVLFQDRCAMDGVSLRSGRCDRFFDAEDVYDDCRPIALKKENEIAAVANAPSQ